MAGEVSTGARAVGYVLSTADNVATLPWGGAKGQRIALRGTLPDGIDGIDLTEDIAPGHKVSLKAISAGEPVLKYGLPIGRARADIAPGSHAHVHNVVSRLSPQVDQPRDAERPAAHIRPGHLRDTLEAVLISAGASQEVARDVALHAVSAEARGVVTHGLRRVPPLVARLRAGGIDGTISPEIEQTGGIIRVNGRNGIGHHVARVAADAVIATARQTGLAAALVRDSSHFGYAGYYASLMAKAGMVGIAVSNGQVLVGPAGALRPIFSNNPVALSAPVGNDRLFEFDMATSVTSRARIAAAAEKGDPIAAGLALDRDGNPTVDAARALEGLLLPMGGAKGFGFIAALEVLTGILPGGAYADQVVSKEAAPDRPEGTSHFLMAISPAAYGDEEGFCARMADLENRLSRLPMSPGSDAARLPGARRAACEARTAQTGIPLEASTLASLQRLAEAAECALRLMAEETT